MSPSPVKRLALIPIRDDEIIRMTNVSERYRYLFSLGLNGKGSKAHDKSGNEAERNEDGQEMDWRGLEPVDTSTLSTTPIRLSPLHSAHLQRIDSISGINNLSTTFAAVCQRGTHVLKQIRLEQAIERKQKQIDDLRNGVLDTDLPFVPQSRHQETYFRNMMEGLMQGQVTLLEGSTGIGKSRAMAVASVQLVRAGRGRVIIAAPTVAIMEHLYDEFQQVEHAGISVAIQPGASEFVDDVRLKEYLLDTADLDEDHRRVAAWVEQGARPAQQDQRPLANFLDSILEHGAAWLMDDLHRIGDNLPVNDFILRHELGHASASREILGASRARAREAQIVLCTHAMLGIGLLTKWQSMPEPDVLMIDEAHTLESSLSTVFSSKLSFYSLRMTMSREARLSRTTANAVNAVAGESAASQEGGKKAGKTGGKTLPDQVRKHLSHTMDMLMMLDVSENKGSVSSICMDSDVDPVHKGRLLENIQQLTKLMASRRFNDMDDISHYRDTLRLLEQSLQTGGQFGNRVDLEFSPDWRYPSLLCGPSSLASRMRSLWDTAKHGVLLTSATLCTMDANGAYKSDYIRNLLALPFDRLSAPMPVIEPRIYSLPTLHVPSQESALLLTPAKSMPDSAGSNGKANGKVNGKVNGRVNSQSRKDVVELEREREREWLAALADILQRQVLDSAVGGTMVLMTSYQQIQLLGEQLLNNGIGADRLIPQRRNRRFASMEQDFRQAHAQGLRPVMLALGSAWTGVDLKDDSARTGEADTLLTDLVIARMPIGLNGSTSMKRRIERMGMHPIVQEALLTLKQGMGRLIRRQDNPRHRRLWLMDGRAFNGKKWPGMEPLLGAVRRQVKEYERVEVF